jgi:ATP-dependent Clp protease ATP-binding subunit ClpC
MPDLDLTAHLVTRTLESTAEGEAQVVVEVLMFPELASLANKERQARSALLDLAEEWLGKQELDEITRRVITGTPEITPVEVIVTPAKRSDAWPEGVHVSLDAVVWDQGAHVVARVPALNIAVVAPDREKLPAMMREHILAAMKREGWNASLLRLAALARGSTSVSTQAWPVRLKSLAERWKESRSEEKGPDALATLCTKMEGVFLTRAFELEEPLKALARLLTLTDRTSVMLVGPAGVGKTALVTEMARRRNDFGLSRHAFYRSSGARLIAGASGFGMWQQRCRELVEAAKAKPTVLYLGNLFELMNVGQSSAGSESIASFLRPSLVRREVQIIVECTPDQLAIIEKNDPRLGDAFRTLRIDEPMPDRAHAILLAASIAMAKDRGRFSKTALERIAALHRRYSGYAAFPGAPLRFMQRVHERVEKEALIEEAEVYAAFSSESGMPLALLDPSARLDLAGTERWFQKRVQGQCDAVQAIVALIAQMKAGLTRPGRPLASLLFIGPTGTGKTEMAKALAEFLFQSPERMIRLDMSEYGQPWSAQRLVSGSHDGREGILTAAVREQPFSVLLFDEFEKADASVFDLLLQVLGEARLTDAAGRLADFSNCVILMTSNLGAQDFSKGRLGFTQAGEAHHDASEHFTSAVRASLRPEMFNRIDRIVPFQPLAEDIVIALTQREIQQAALRPGIAGRSMQLHVSEALVQHLANKGYDPRYGARPLKRRVAEELLAPLAASIAEGVDEKSQVHAGLDADGRVTLRISRGEIPAGEREALMNLKDRLRHAARLRQDYEKLRASTMMNSLQGRLRMMEQRLRALRPKARRVPTWQEHDPEQEMLRSRVTRIERDAQRQLAHEESLMLALHGGHLEELSQKDPLTRSHLEDAALDALMLWQPPPKAIVLGIQGMPGASLLAFAAIYRDLARELGGSAMTGVFHKQTPVKLLTQDALHAHADAPESETAQHELWKIEPGKIAAIALWISGGQATLFLKDEGGLHLTRASRDSSDDDNKIDRPAKPSEKKQILTAKDWQCRIDILVPEGKMRSLADLKLPLAKLTALPNLESGPMRRQYDPTRGLVRDGASGERVEGAFQTQWLLRTLRAARMKEVLE